METVEEFKSRMAILRSTDVEELRSFALDFLGTCRIITHAPHGNDTYSACMFGDDNKWHKGESGTKDFCVGFATGKMDFSDPPCKWIVTCGVMIVWPEEMFGEIIQQKGWM